MGDCYLGRERADALLSRRKRVEDKGTSTEMPAWCHTAPSETPRRSSTSPPRRPSLREREREARRVCRFDTAVSLESYSRERYCCSKSITSTCSKVQLELSPLPQLPSVWWRSAAAEPSTSSPSPRRPRKTCSSSSSGGAGEGKRVRCQLFEGE